MLESPAKVQMWEDIIETLSKQRIKRLRPFVEARNPRDSNDPGTLAFSEAEGSKLESFGIQVRFPFTRFESPLAIVWTGSVRVLLACSAICHLRAPLM